MVHELKSDRWLGYAALICATIVIAVVRFAPPSIVASNIVLISVGPCGLYLAIRSVLIGNMSNRICAGFALVFLGWLIYWIYTTTSVLRDVYYDQAA